MALLTLIQQQGIKIISQNWANASKVTGAKSNYDQLAEEVENKELRNLLGVALFQDVQANPTTDENVVLLDGGSYEDCNGNTITFKGLRYVLAYFNWSKYVAESFVSDTFTGMVRKQRTEAENLTSGDIKRLQIDAREIALQEWELIRNFLNENESDYPLWECAKTKKIYTPRITGVKRTIL